VGYGRELHGIPELRQAPNQAVFLPLLAAGIEVVGAEVQVNNDAQRVWRCHPTLMKAPARPPIVTPGLTLRLFSLI